MNNPGMLKAWCRARGDPLGWSAMAGSFGLREQSAYSQGASFAGAAAPGDSLSAMFWNPAAVTIADGLQTESHFTFILPTSELDDPSKTLGGGLPGYGNGGDVGIDAFLPASYSAYKVNDSLYLGLSVVRPYGLAPHSSETPWVGQADHLKAKVRSTAVTPTIATRSTTC